MKTITKLLVFFLIVCGHTLSQTGSYKSLNLEIEFSINIDENSKLSNKKLITLTLKNNSKKRVIVKEVGNETERNYIVEVKNSKGEIVSMSEEGKRLTKPLRIEMAVVYARLEPKEEITRSIDLSKLFTFNRNERYKIVLKKSVYVEAESNNRILESNLIELKK